MKELMVDGVNELSTDPLSFSCIIRLAGTPLNWLNVPAIRNFPFERAFRSYTVLFVPGEILGPTPTSNVGSREPSAFKRAMRFLEIPLYEVKVPPIMIL